MPSSACYCDHRALHSFPTRRSSDLAQITIVNAGIVDQPRKSFFVDCFFGCAQKFARRALGAIGPIAIVDAPTVNLLSGPKLRNGFVDRKSTRLNSSHTVISYAVFCLLL